MVSAPSLSVTVMLTILSSGPSVALKNQFQVPSPLSVTVPIDAFKVTESKGRSYTLPVLTAISPSFTVTLFVSIISVGARLPTSTFNSRAEASPESSVTSRVTVYRPLSL